MELITYGNDEGTDIRYHIIPESHREMAETRREEMIEKIVENDEYLTMKFLEEEEITDEEIVGALRAGTISGALHPVMCGAALKNKGVQALLNMVVALLPSPLDIPPVAGEHPKDGSELRDMRTTMIPWRRWSSRLSATNTDALPLRASIRAC